MKGFSPILSVTRKSKILISFIFALLFVLLFTSGCAQEPQELREPSNITPLMWHVTSPEGQTMYLFGSIHAATEDIYPLPTAIMDAFNSCDYLAVEADQNSYNGIVREHINKKALYEDGKTIVDEIGSDLYERAKEALFDFGMEGWLARDVLVSHKTLDDFKPYMWEELLTIPSSDMSEISRELGLDEFFIAEARKRRIDVLEIEPRGWVYEVMNTFSTPLNVFLIETAINTQSIESHRLAFEEIYDAWKQGDAQRLNELVFSREDMPEELKEEYFNAIYIVRDVGMVEAAVRYMDEGKTVFFVTGAGHMVREGGIVDSLRERGYTVEQVVWWE